MSSKEIPSNPRSLTGMPYTVMSYNIKQLSMDVAAAALIIHDAAPDVLAIQEPPKWWRGRSRTKAFARQIGMVCVASGGWPGNSGSTALFLRPELMPQVKRIIKRGLPWRLTWLLPKFPSRRGYCAVDLGDLVVFSVHLSLEERERAEHRNIILQVAQEFDPGRCVIAGDLNERPDGPSWVALGRKLQDPALGSQIEAPDTGIAAQPMGTYPAHKPRHRIDAIFVGDSLTAQNYRVWGAPQGTDTRDYTLWSRVPKSLAGLSNPDLAIRASDHLPIAVEVGTHSPKNAPK